EKTSTTKRSGGQEFGNPNWRPIAVSGTGFTPRLAVPAGGLCRQAQSIEQKHARCHPPASNSNQSSSKKLPEGSFSPGMNYPDSDARDGAKLCNKGVFGGTDVLLPG